MTKQQFKMHWQAMYRVGNRADADEHEDWTNPAMAGGACCALLDKMGNELIKCGVWTEEERQELLDTL